MELIKTWTPMLLSPATSDSAAMMSAGLQSSAWVVKINPCSEVRTGRGMVSIGLSPAKMMNRKLPVGTGAPTSVEVMLRVTVSAIVAEQTLASEFRYKGIAEPKLLILTEYICLGLRERVAILSDIFFLSSTIKFIFSHTQEW